MKFIRLAPPNKNLDKHGDTKRRKTKGESLHFLNYVWFQFKVLRTQLGEESELNYVTCVITLKSAIAL